MKLKYYEIDEKKLLEAAKNGKKIAIKMPEGLQPYAAEIMKFLKKNGIDASFLADSCYGACDFKRIEGIDRIICIGEAEMPYLRKKYSPPVTFIEAFYHFNAEIVGKAIPLLEESRIGLVSITPFIHKINECKKYLEDRGYEVFIGRKSRRMKYNGQILGCDFTPAMEIAGNVDVFLFIGDGMFHPVALFIATKKPVVALNPIGGGVLRKEITDAAAKIVKQRYATIAKAMDGKRVGIIMAEKIGQRRPRLARELKKMAEKAGMEAYLIIADEIDDRLNYLDFDFYISTACPRVAIDDAAKFKKPVLTPIEFQIMINERQWEDYEFDQIV